MKKNRIIPVLLLKNGYLVKSKHFGRYQNLGNPVTAVKRLSEWASDELIYLDITKDGDYDLRRDDLAYQNRSHILDIIKDVSKMTLMPITVGGRIKNIEDIELRLANGADKVIINSILFENPSLLNEASKIFGSQCMVVCVDYKIVEQGIHLYDHKSKELLKNPVKNWIDEMVDRGAGEIMLHAVDRDGTLLGYDIETIEAISSNTNVPIVACGGAGSWEHMAEVLKNTRADAVAAANIFQYTDQSVFIAKKYLFEKNCNVRNPNVLTIKEKENALL